MKKNQMMRKETRDETARRKLKTKTEEKEIAFGVQIRLVNKKQEYIRNLINGRYYLARCNMMAEQIQTEEIKEKIDGCIKSMEYMRSEYALMKMQAIMGMRTAHFSKQDLVKDFNQTKDEIYAIEADYYDGKIIREDYDEEYKRKTKAEFVDSPKD